MSISARGREVGIDFIGMSKGSIGSVLLARDEEEGNKMNDRLRVDGCLYSIFHISLKV